jgi:hypothetical protein
LSNVGGREQLYRSGKKNTGNAQVNGGDNRQAREIAPLGLF